MNVFNSLGSNYNFSFVLKSLLSFGTKNDLSKLTDFLSKKYGGETLLFYKGREALTAALKISDIPHSSHIAMNGFTCVAVFNAIRTAGFEPTCLDLKETAGLNFTAKTLEAEVKKNKKIKAVVIQNTLGYPCEIKKIEAICKKNNLLLIEDLAHCVGTKYEDGREAGTVGNFTVLSFSQDKIIDAISGGALVVRNSKFKMQNGFTASRAKLKVKRQNLKDQAYPTLTWVIRNTYPVGLGKAIHALFRRIKLLPNIMDESLYDFYALPDWHAKCALYGFKKLENQLKHRKKIANIYAESLPEGLFMLDKPNTIKAVSLSSNLRFPVFLKNKEDRVKFIKYLKGRGVYLSDIWYTDVAPECPNAVEDSKIILNLPTHINVTEEDALHISEIINKWLKST